MSGSRGRVGGRSGGRGDGFRVWGDGTYRPLRPSLPGRVRPLAALWSPSAEVQNQTFRPPFANSARTRRRLSKHAGAGQPRGDDRTRVVLLPAPRSSPHATRRPFLLEARNDLDAIGRASNVGRLHAPRHNLRRARIVGARHRVAKAARGHPRARVPRQRGSSRVRDHRRGEPARARRGARRRGDQRHHARPTRRRPRSGHMDPALRATPREDVAGSALALRGVLLLQEDPRGDRILRPRVPRVRPRPFRG